MSRAISALMVPVVAALLAAGCRGSSDEPAEPTGGGEAAEEGEGEDRPDEERAEPTKAAPEPETPEAGPAVVANQNADSGTSEAEAGAEAAETPPAAEADEPETAQPPTVPSGGVEVIEREGLRVRRLILARNVEDREPVDPSTRFSAAAGGRVYAFIEVDNPARTEAELTIAWTRASGGEERGATTVRVGAMPRWRTWAFTSVARHSGNMLAVVRDSEGNLLARANFEVTP